MSDDDEYEYVYEDEDEDNEDSEPGDTDEDECSDIEGNFRVWFGGERDCGWVDQLKFFRCLFYDDRCPETCGDC